MEFKKKVIGKFIQIFIGYITIFLIIQGKYLTTSRNQNVMKVCEFQESKEFCGNEGNAYCVSCGIPICSRHQIATSEGVMCLNCTTKASMNVDSVTPVIEYPSNDDEAFWDQIS